MEDAIDLELFVGTKTYVVADAPAGILITKDNILIVKTEYFEVNHCECYNMAGERCVNLDAVECKSLIIK
jgi:hypothetical protein